jgi:hypothetical protein
MTIENPRVGGSNPSPGTTLLQMMFPYIFFALIALAFDVSRSEDL